MFNWCLVVEFPLLNPRFDAHFSNMKTTRLMHWAPSCVAVVPWNVRALPHKLSKSQCQLVCRRPKKSKRNARPFVPSQARPWNNRAEPGVWLARGCRPSLVPPCHPRFATAVPNRMSTLRILTRRTFWSGGILPTLKRRHGWPELDRFAPFKPCEQFRRPIGCLT